MKGRPTLLGDILAGSKLADLASRARDAESLCQQIKDLLPEPEGAHVTGASRNGDTVIILADTAAWATRIRFHAPGLLKWLSPKFDGTVDRVRVRVRPDDGA